MRGLSGDRLLKRFLGNILHPPEFNQRRVLGSTADHEETTGEKAQSQTPDPGDEMTNASAAKAAVDEKSSSSPVWKDSINGNKDKI